LHPQVKLGNILEETNCVHDSVAEIKILIRTCLWGAQVYLGSSLETHDSFKLVQIYVREASFI
jgi:hypothetical protein